MNKLAEKESVCPKCGLRQPHAHLGWLVLGNHVINDGVLFVRVECTKCNTDSIIVMFEALASVEKRVPLQEAIRRVFEQNVVSRLKVE